MTAAPQYLEPASLREALDLLAEGGTAVVGGGTQLVPALRDGGPGTGGRPRRLLDPRRIAELSGIRQDPDRLSIGALTRLSDLASSPQAAARAPLLSRAAGITSVPQLRNRGTLGGKLFNPGRFAEIAASLLVLGGEVRLLRAGGERRAGLAEFLCRPGEPEVSEDELLVSVDVNAARPLRASLQVIEPLRWRSPYHLALALACPAPSGGGAREVHFALAGSAGVFGRFERTLGDGGDDGAAWESRAAAASQDFRARHPEARDTYADLVLEGLIRRGIEDALRERGET